MKWRRRVGPFLKEFVKWKRFSSGWLRKGSAGRSLKFFRFVGREDSCVLLVVSVSGFVSVVVATGSCDRSFPSAIAPNTFLRKVPLTITVSSSAWSGTRADADVSGANSSPEGPLHPQRRAAGPGHCWLRPPHPRSDSSWPQREGSQVAIRQLRSNNRAEAWLISFPLWFVYFDSPFAAPTIPLTWAEDRATVGTDLSAGPGANTEWGGTMPPSSIRVWHQGAKSPRPRCSPALARVPLMYTLVYPFLWLLLRREPGTRRRSSVCSACAR